MERLTSNRFFYLTLAVLAVVALGLPKTSAVAAEAKGCVVQKLADMDCDGLADEWEEKIFMTGASNPDSDSDGYADGLEIKNSFDPNGKGGMKSGDFDSDGLDDRLELLFGADPAAADSDGDGHADGQEVAAGFSPTSASKKPLEKKIVIKISTQEMSQTLGGVVLSKYKVSTGRKGAATPPGEYKVMNKNPRAWSRSAKLWMPYWMQFSNSGMGIHELPEWPNGRKEGEDHLGTPASGGCVRLGVGSAKTMYDWTPVGTKISIVR